MKLLLISLLVTLGEGHNHHGDHRHGHKHRYEENHHHHDHHNHHHHRHEKKLPEYATQAVSFLEKAYVEDCQADPSPHGYYGAFLETCEFTFWRKKSAKGSRTLKRHSSSSSSSSSSSDSYPLYGEEKEEEVYMIASATTKESRDEEKFSSMIVAPKSIIPDEDEEYGFDPKFCSKEFSEIVSKPFPMNWVLNLTQHYERDDWDELSFSSSDDFQEIADQLMLWPDQCVGYTPRCYEVADPLIKDILTGLFADDGIPEGAEFVSVNCQADAVAASRVVYAFASGLEKSTPTIIAWLVTVVLFALVASLWCCYGCFRLCLCRPRDSSVSYAAVASPVVEGKAVHGDYHAVSDRDEEEAALKQNLVE